MIFCFAYLSAVWLIFWENPIELILDKYFLLNFALIFTKQLIGKQTQKIFLISSNIEYCFFCKFLAQLVRAMNSSFFFYTIWKNYFKRLNMCPYQLGNKFPKETILNIWRNEKYFSDLLIYQLFGYNLAKIQLTSSQKIILHWILP